MINEKNYYALEVILYTLNLVVVILIFFVIRFTGSILLGTSVEEDHLKPKITQTELPFKLEYKIDNENKVIEDTWACKYTGLIWRLWKGRSRVWSAQLKDESKEIVLYENGDVKVYYKINPKIYMGDAIFMNSEQAITQYIYIDKNENGRKVYKQLTNEIKLKEEYGIEIIKIEIADPIVNDFVEYNS